MRAVAQRVSSASVLVDGETVGAIGPGILAYVGVADGDTDTDLEYVAQKLAGLRIFPDDAGKMSLSVSDTSRDILIVSQFTLFGDVRNGRRPSFTGAAAPELASAYCDRLASRLGELGLRVATGRFRASMLVRADVDGPVTILVDSRKLF